jgi:hypothetical protein
LIVNGQVVVEWGQLVTADEAELAGNAAAAAKKVMSR